MVVTYSLLTEYYNTGTAPQDQTVFTEERSHKTKTEDYILVS